MSITRHNYEEYFILYMDNELGSEDRRMVELFLQNNPDLKEELDSLLQYKMEPDTAIVFDGKEELLKVNGETPISHYNYEEWFVLYTDNELTASQKNTVDQFIAANPALKKELDLLQKIRLQPEPIEFKYKQSLYRKEEKVRAVPFIRWRSAAAILLFLIGLTTVIILNNKPAGIQKDGVAKANPGEQKNNTPGPGTSTVAENQVAATTNETTPVTNTKITDDNKQEAIPSLSKENNTPVAQKVNNNRVPEQNLPENSPAPIKNEVAITQDNIKPTNNLPQPLYNPNINTNAVTNNATAKVNIPDNATLQNALTNAVVTNNNTSPSGITDASFNDDGSGKKNKLRGFFRKVTRTFEKRTNIDPTDGEDRLLVAGLSIKMK
ncbi:MAG: hypothetical protein JNM19_17685 [Chitinophagaceae bacterium]|nr:hypothetical protein [Chitinophagaceae bacterium]